MASKAFNDILRDAVADLAEHGYDDRKRVDTWLVRLREAAAASSVSEQQMQARLVRVFGDRFRRHMRTVARGRHRGIDRFTLKRIEPALRQELDKRILASVRLIVLNRDEAIQTTLKRFEGWATAIPAGGSMATNRTEAYDEIGKPVRRIPYSEKRVAIDQGHKLISAVDDVIAIQGDAVGAIWHSHWRESGYDYRPAHKKLDGRVFLLRDSWAVKDGLVKKPGGEFYIDQVERPAEEPFCRCYYQYLYSLADLPGAYLTARGKLALRGERRAANS